MRITELKKPIKKQKIKQVIVVEGKTDTNHLKKIFDVDTIETNGSAISKSTLNLMKLLLLKIVEIQKRLV